MIGLLLRLYPARWRARYGDEFAVLLEERPIGPFDVADILLGALDAHLHLRGLGAASEHAKGFPMSLRIGGYAAILGGLLWFVGLAGSAVDPSDDAMPWAIALASGTLLLLVALAGLSAFQSRRFPRLVWAAFSVPALGAVISTIGMVAMAVVGDRPFVGDASPWYVWMLGLIAMLVGSALFAVATWRVGSLSRPGAILLLVGSVAVVPALFGLGGVDVPPVLGQLLLGGLTLAFGGGWVALGVSALRLGRPISASLTGAQS
jgi:hypothetical protein